MRTDSFRHCYTKKEIDFIACYVVPGDVWYIVPVKVAEKLAGNIWLSPHRPVDRHKKFMEAWDLFR